MDIKNIKLRYTKSRESLLDEFKNVKENPIIHIVVLPAILLSGLIPESIIPFKTTASVFIWGVYILLVIMTGLNRVDKKVNILYEMERNRHLNEK